MDRLSRTCTIRLYSAALLLALTHFAMAQGGGVELWSPRGGESWSAGSLHAITWRAPAEVTSVLVTYSLDEGTTWANAAEGELPSLPDVDNRLVWTVPDATGRKCLLRVAARGESAMEHGARSEFSVTASERGDYEWTCVANPAAFAGRDGAGALSFNGKMWLLGGWNPGDKVNFPHVCNSEVWSSTDGATWTEEVAEAPWFGRHTAGYVVHNGRMWVVGGDCIQRRYQNDVWSSADGIQWDLVTDRVPWADRVLHYTVAFDGKIWVMGGQTLPQFAPAEEIFYDDVWCSVDGAEWTRVTDHAGWPHRGMIGGSVVLDGRMWVLGGGVYDTPKRPDRTFYNDVWASSDGANWECVLDCAPWHPRQYHDVAVFDGRMWVMEGWNQGNRNDVWYSADGANWYELPDTPWAPRHAASVFVHDDALWMVAGNNMFPDVWKLTRKR